MRIRNVREVDIPRLIELQLLAVETDGIEAKSMSELEAWLTSPDLEHNVFVVTDDDDELNQWGQAETLEGIEGEVVGFTALSLQQDEPAYHFLCQGTVHPQHRRRNAGRALLICALNRARLLATEFEFEAEQEGRPIYLEALLPVHDSASGKLATKCEMQPTDAPAPKGTRLFRREL